MHAPQEGEAEGSELSLRPTRAGAVPQCPLGFCTEPGGLGARAVPAPEEPFERRIWFPTNLTPIPGTKGRQAARPGGRQACAVPTRQPRENPNFLLACRCGPGTRGHGLRACPRQGGGGEGPRGPSLSGHDSEVTRDLGSVHGRGARRQASRKQQQSCEEGTGRIWNKEGVSPWREDSGRERRGRHRGRRTLAQGLLLPGPALGGWE